MKIQKQIGTMPVFGWNKTTHLEMTLLAAKDLGVNNVEKRVLARYSQFPDLDKTQSGFFNNTHFFFPKSYNNSFGKGCNRGNNAYSMFIQHVNNAFSAKTKEEFFKHAGYALHFLQEMSMPMHTKAGNIISKILEFKTHIEFEQGKKNGATSRLPKLIKNYIPTPLSFTSYTGLFIQTAEFSQSPQFRITPFNKSKWFEIQKECFARGVDSSTAFLEQISKNL